MKKEIIIGTKYNNLTIIKELPDYISPKGDKVRIVLCKCICGNEKIMRYGGIKYGASKTCGCNKGNKKHGLCYSRIWLTFRNLKTRCNNVNSLDFKDYGGRGIKCEWNTFEEFYKDMNQGYSDNLTIDRINVNGNYCKENCRWADIKTQSRNKRNNHYITYNGKTQSLKDWSEELGFIYKRIHQRITKYKRSFEKAIQTEYGIEKKDIEFITIK